MTAPDPHQRVLIVAPVEGDAAAISSLLKQQDLEVTVCKGTGEACEQLQSGAGALVLADEALGGSDTDRLFALLKAQPTWSELPLIVLTQAKTQSRFEQLIGWLAKSAGSITVLERPISTLTLLRSVNVALRSRNRQYQVRDLLIQQQQREFSLRQSEERLRVALEGAELGSFDVDMRTGHAVWNRRHAGFIDHALDGGPGSFALWRDRVHPDDLERVLQEIETARLERRSIALQHRVRNETATEPRWLALYGRFYYDESGEAVRLSGVSRDITEEKGTADAMRRAQDAQAQLAAIVNSTSDAIIGLDLTGLITTWNRGAEQLYGYSAAKMLGTPVMRLVPPELHEEHAQSLERVRRGRSVEAYETMRTRSDGRRFHVSLNVSPILDPQGRVVGASKIARDITLLVAARSMQQALTDQLQESDQRKNQFLATLSHELRNPLAPIRNASLILASPKLSPEQLKWSREIIHRQAQHMSRLLDDLLDIARVTHGKLSLQRSNTLLSTAIDAAIESVQPLRATKKHQLSVNLPAQSVELNADAVRLTQIFGNLLTNAMKYTAPGGRIELIGELKPGAVEVTVRDNGMGIAPEMLPKIFEMFTQASETKAYDQGGLGIGLALTKGLVELHGGSIRAKSQPGVGSEFTVTLPVAVIPAAAITSARQSASQLQKSLRILVVDDNHDAADSLALLLQSEGHTVASAYDGARALQSASVAPPHVALLDLGMPNMDGYQLARHIREHDWGRDIKLIALTGWGQEQDRRRTRAASFDAHLVKPVGLTEIRAVLHTLVESPQA